MTNGRADIQWSPRVPKRKLRRLYELEARGLLDDKLVDDVGITLLLRCRDILTIEEARHGRVKCPRCARQKQHAVIQRAVRKGDPRDEVIECTVCGWRITWGEYALSFKRRQLNAGGAVSAFAAYVRSFKAARTPRTKMLAIDRLIHEFHYSMRDRPDVPARSVGVNLIQGKLTDVIRFLDDLAYGDGTPQEMVENLADWRAKMDECPYFDLPANLR